MLTVSWVPQLIWQQFLFAMVNMKLLRYLSCWCPLNSLNVYCLMWFYHSIYNKYDNHYPYFCLKESSGHSRHTHELCESISSWPGYRSCTLIMPSSQWILPSGACTWWSKHCPERIQGSWSYPMLLQVPPSTLCGVVHCDLLLTRGYWVSWSGLSVIDYVTLICYSNLNYLWCF